MSNSSVPPPATSINNSSCIKSYFSKPVILNLKKQKHLDEMLKGQNSEQVTVFGYADKSDKNYAIMKKRFNLLQYQEIYSSNRNLSFALINDPKVAQQLNMFESGDISICQKGSGLNAQQPNFIFNGKSFLLLKSSNIKKSLQNIIDDNSQAYSRANIFYNRSFGVDKCEFALTLEVDKNRLSKE